MKKSRSNTAIFEADDSPGDWPVVPIALAEYLVRVFPPKCIEPEESLAAAHHYAGKVALAETIFEIAHRARD